jgi:hypothetical protein
MKKVSFDFDSTLDKRSVQKYALDLINKGFEVWICTSRLAPENANEGWNDDLFLVSDKLGVERGNIIFTNYEDKSDHLNEKGFIWHLDDDWIELNQINKKTDLKGVSVFGNNKWKSKCNKILNNCI